VSLKRIISAVSNILSWKKIVSFNNGSKYYFIVGNKESHINAQLIPFNGEIDDSELNRLKAVLSNSISVGDDKSIHIKISAVDIKKIVENIVVNTK
jgi:hypothetical protein